MQHKSKVNAFGASCKNSSNRALKKKLIKQSIIKIKKLIRQEFRYNVLKRDTCVYLN